MRTTRQTQIAAVLSLITLAGGCSSVEVETTPYDVRNSCPIGRIVEVTMGDTMCWVVGGHWMEAFEAQRPIVLPGFDPIAVGSTWTQTLVEQGTGVALLLNVNFDSDIALRVLKDGRLATDPSAIQIGGMKRGRRWNESPSSSEIAMKWVGYQAHPEYFDQKGWRLYYVGIDNKKLRFTAEDLRAGGEAIGGIEYTHDLGAGDTFVFRGMAVKVGGVAPDGRFTFTVTSPGRI